MLKTIITSICIAIILSTQLFAHSGKPKYHIVIDTDGAIDDMRSISTFLSGNEIRVLAITCSQGTLKPEDVYIKVNDLLSSFHHEGIPVGIGQVVAAKLPVWTSFAENIKWGNDEEIQNGNVSPDALQILSQSTENYKSKITLIALGSLKTYADWIRADSSVLSKIERIVWYNHQNIQKGFNYQVSPESFNFIKSSGISLEIVSSNTSELLVDEAYLNEIKKTKSIYAQQIKQVHEQPEVVAKIKQKHLQLWDDIVPLYLTAPVLFEISVIDEIQCATLSNAIPVNFIYESIGKLLSSASQTNNRVFASFPIDTTLYKPNYSAIVNNTIAKFGLIEWKAITLTNEIHGHTGIYSIIGAKMGIRAMEYFNIGVNNMEVTTFAGNVPPLSCFNDGIQISTGATIGQGLITVSDSISTIPSAIFEFNGRKINISVKPEIAEKMQKEIIYGVQNYGLLTDKYWIYIEDLAIKYWAELNRYDIFLIHETYN